MFNSEEKTDIPVEFQEKLDSIDVEVKKLLKDIDYLGEIGKIDESERLYEEVERLWRAREDLVI
jgi:RNA-binding protein Luc7-like 2